MKATRAFLHTIWCWRVDLYSSQLLLRLINTPLRLQQRNHAYPLFRSASFVVYICVPSVNYAVASHEGDQSLPTHHMVVESRHLHLFLLLRLVETPLRLQQRNHAYPLFRSASFVIYICVPSVNYAVASHEGDQGLPTHHMVVESRHLHLFLLLRSPCRDTSTTTATQPCISIVS